MVKKEKWIDLTEQGIYLGKQRMADGKKRLILLDMKSKGNPISLREIGFRPVRGSPRYDKDIYYLYADDQQLHPKVLAEAFGIKYCPIIEVSSDEIDQVFRKKILEKFGANLNSLTLRSRLLGQNREGYPVYDSPTGRFIRLSSDNAVTEGSRRAIKFSGTDFLRAANDEDLYACAEGFLWTIRKGSKTTWRDLVNFAEAIFDTKRPSNTQLHRLQEAVEAASYRYFNAVTNNLDESALKHATDFYYGLPVARMRTAESIFLQQYSTPLPLSVIAQNLLIGNDDLSKKTILEPTAGNGALVNILSKNVQVFGVELDNKRFVNLQGIDNISAYQGNAINTNFRHVFGIEHGFDYCIANPPFGQMDEVKIFDKLKNVRKLDHYISLKALNARKDNGRSVILFSADNALSNGSVKRESQSFLNYIYDHYEVLGLTEIDGRLYTRQGAGFNIRLLVIGNKRHEAIHANVPDKLSIITSYDSLWKWAKQTIGMYDIGKEKIDELIDNPKININIFSDLEPIFSGGKEAILNIKQDELIDENVSSRMAFIDNSNNLVEKNNIVDRRVNEFQAPYQSASQIADSTAMVPINMAGATYAALNDLQETFGQIDHFVAEKLHYDKDELALYFSPEQIDAIGLAIRAVETGRGIINADQTGMGKGRFVAAMLRYAKINEKIPIFLTIKPELFTDIFRDISDINSQNLFKKLFIFNDGESVKRFGSENELLYRATTTQERKKALVNGKVDPDTDMVLATYSQFMRAYQKNPKALLLTEIAANNSLLILDESHIASGASNLAMTVGQAVTASSAVLYASATPLKGISNFSVYSKIFPKSVDLRILPDTLKAGGETLQEAISTNMARDGVLIRREHDFSQLTFHNRNPEKTRYERNITLANAFAEIVSEMSYLSGDISKSVSDLNKNYKHNWEKIPERERNGARMQASSMNFASRLYNLNRQFLLAIKIEEAVETALEDLASGRKSVIAVENTGETLLRQVITRKAGIEHLEIELTELDERNGTLSEKEIIQRNTLLSSINKALRNVTLDKPPQYRELLESILDRIGVIRIQGRYGEVQYTKPESIEYQEAEESLRKKIRAFPDLALTPIDIIKKSLQEHGNSVAEVSGRTVSIIPNSYNPELWDVNFHTKANAVANVAGFQNGKYDAIVITRSGSTGISLHATDRFEDSDIRQRNFIVLQKAANIAEFLQWMGRVNRKDQVTPPIITGLESGLPAELRLTMMHNAKLRKLSANTTSNRDNANLEGEEFDLLNDVGDHVALEWLSENPDIADLLDIQLPDDDLENVTRFSQECLYINKLMGRLMMVSVEKQEEILKALTDRFIDKLEELKQRGENPFKVEVFEWKAKIIKEEELQSGIIHSVSSTFDEPVKLVTIQYEQDIYPICSKKLMDLIKNGLELFYSDSLVDQNNSLHDFKKQLSKMKNGWIRSQLPTKLRESESSLSKLLESKEVIGAKLAQERADWLLMNIETFRPGYCITYEDTFKGERKGIITSVNLPKNKEEFFLLSKYRAKIAFPGENKTREITLATIRSQGNDLFSDSWISIDPINLEKMPHTQERVAQILDDFDKVPNGKVTRTQHVLQGNIFRACELASSQKLGSPILFTDEQGNRQRAILLKERVTPDMIKALPISFDADDVFNYIKQYFDPKQPNSQQHNNYNQIKIYDRAVKHMKRGEGIMLEIFDGGDTCCLSIPGTKTKAGPLMSDGAIFDIGEKSSENSLKLKLSGTRSCMQATVQRDELYSLLKKMQENRYISKFYIPSPDHDVIQAMKAYPKKDHEIVRKIEDEMLSFG